MLCQEGSVRPDDGMEGRQCQISYVLQKEAVVFFVHHFLRIEVVYLNPERFLICLWSVPLFFPIYWLAIQTIFDPPSQETHLFKFSFFLCSVSTFLFISHLMVLFNFWNMWEINLFLKEAVESLIHLKEHPDFCLLHHFLWVAIRSAALILIPLLYFLL